MRFERAGRGEDLVLFSAEGGVFAFFDDEVAAQLVQGADTLMILAEKGVCVHV